MIMQTKKPSEKNTILKKKQKGRENERGKNTWDKEISIWEGGNQNKEERMMWARLTWIC